MYNNIQFIVKRYSINLMLLIIMSINSSFINQENTIEKIKKAIEITSPREIINLLHDDYELNIENELINSNKNKTELVLKNFFDQQPLKTLNFIHEGEVNNEINYILAEYKTETSSYSIIIFIKKKFDNLKISRLIINKE
ncbi:MAG: hypothetical protein CMF54_05090 [Legionellales bacterium]|nr:hypothetical protein [Legionellales bacterium]